MNVFNSDALFIWDIPWFVSWSFSWTTSLTVTLGSTDGGGYFLNISGIFVNSSLCTFPILNSSMSGDVFCSA